jgi:N-methylhydantoinase B
VTQDCVVSTCIDRSVIPPFGLFGGSDGAPNLIYLKRKGTSDWEPVSPRMSNLPIKAGDMVRIESAIGGGYGNPLEREPELVREDVRDGYLTPEQARDVYGVVLDGELDVDGEATARLRAELGERTERSPRYPERTPQFTGLGG